MTNKITVLVKYPGKLPKLARIRNDYTEIQRIVKGGFEIAHVDRGLVAFVNDVSALNGMHLCCVYNGYPLFGPVIFAGSSGPETVSIPMYHLVQIDSALCDAARIIEYADEMLTENFDVNYMREIHGKDFEKYEQDVLKYIILEDEVYYGREEEA